MGFGVASSHFVFEMGVKIGFVGMCFPMCMSQQNMPRAIRLFSEVLDMDIRNYLSRKRSRKEVDVSDSAIFVQAYILT